MSDHNVTDEPQGVQEVLGELDELAAHHRKVCIADMLDDFGKRSFGPFIRIPPLIELSPIGGIPGVPTFLAVIVALTAAQLFMGKDHVWLPQIIQRQSISGRRLHQAVTKLRGIALWLDEHSHGRFEQLVEGVGMRVAAVAIIALCCTVPPLEFIPFASSAPMLAIAALGLALTVRDGLLLLIALVLAASAATVGGYLLITNPIG